MPRQPRFEYPNAFYHVMNRGRNKDKIFHNKQDFELFLTILSQAVTKFNAILHCYCLMGNHYHLLLETPDANLSKIMHFIGRKYVAIYNKKKGLDGALFKSRYKSILIDKDSYLIELNRYIHRNPVGRVENLSAYKWSSYPAYLNISKTPFWLNKKDTLELFGNGNDPKEYLKFIESHEERSFYGDRRNNPSIFGADDFKNTVVGM